MQGIFREVFYLYKVKGIAINMATITMAHGSGGSESAQLIEELFLKHIGNDLLNEKGDAAFLPGGGRLAFSTDSFVVDPVFFPGGDIGKLAVCGTVNDLLCTGATPRWLSAGFILEEGLPLADLEKIIISMKMAASEAGVIIACADTKVIEGKGGIYINTSGIGTLDTVDIRPSGGKPGDAVIVSGHLGDHHACILSQRMGIQNNIQSDCGLLTQILSAMRTENIVVHAMRDITRGGLATVLNELCASSDVFCEVAETAIPTSAVLRSFCDILGLDPLYMANEGKMLLFVGGADEKTALAALHNTNVGKNAVCIGYLKDNKATAPYSARVSIKTRLGGSRPLDALTGEGLPRIC